MENDIYIALCLATFAVCSLVSVKWAHDQIKMGRKLPTRLWWLEKLAASRIVRHLFG